MAKTNNPADSNSTNAQLSLPGFTYAGKLPPGEHTSDWQHFYSRFGFNAHRRRYMRFFESFANDYKLRGGVEIVIGGSFVTCKPLPSDIDFSIDTSAPLRCKLEGLKVPKLKLRNKLIAPLNFLPDLVELENGEQFSARVFFANDERIGVSDNSIGIVIVKL